MNLSEIFITPGIFDKVKGCGNVSTWLQTEILEEVEILMIKVGTFCLEVVQLVGREGDICKP